MRTRTSRQSICAALAAALLLPAAATAKIPFAPYVDMASYPPPALAKWGKQAKVRLITLGFVTAREGTVCDPTWGGYADYPATGEQPYRIADVRKLRSRRGDAIVSFGGAVGTDLATVCSSSAELADAYAAVVDAYGAKRLDFDVEGATASDAAANERRATAVAALQKRNPKLRVSLTVAVLPTGLTAEGLALVEQMKRAGVKLSLVNIMAMDYGDAAAPDPEGAMGRYAVEAARSTIDQLEPVFGRFAAAHLSVTPMIGINDVASEVFTLDDARKLRRWGGRVKLGGLSMWQLGRDQRCPKPVTTTQLDCSGVRQGRWAFSKLLGK